jgi:hypothetical protein
MERYCGVLQAGLRSRSAPWANLNNLVLHKAYLEQLGVLYDLDEELSSVKRAKGSLSRTEFVYDGCKWLAWFEGTVLT